MISGYKELIESGKLSIQTLMWIHGTVDFSLRFDPAKVQQEILEPIIQKLAKAGDCLDLGTDVVESGRASDEFKKAHQALYRHLAINTKLLKELTS